MDRKGLDAKPEAGLELDRRSKNLNMRKLVPRGDTAMT